MKKTIIFALAGFIALVTFGAYYNADTLGVRDQTYTGAKKSLYFSVDTASLSLSNDTVVACYIPANARIIGGEISFEAMAGTATADIGLKGADNSGYVNNAGTDADDPDQFADGIAVSSATRYEFATLSPNGSALSAVAAQNINVITEVSTQTLATNEIVYLNASTNAATNTIIYVSGIANAYTTNSVSTNVTTTADATLTLNTSAGFSTDKPCYLTITAPAGTSQWADDKTITGVLYYIEP